METLEAWTIDVPGDAGYNRWKNTESCYSPLSGTVFPNSGTNHLAYTGYFGGTSCSCPEVAAVAALMLSMNPELTQQDVFNIINSTARKDGGYSYQITAGISNGTWNAQMGHGVLDAYAAVRDVCPAVVNYNNQTVVADTTVISCGDINVRNVTVNSGKLTLKAAGKVNIISGFEVKPGAKLEIIKIK